MKALCLNRISKDLKELIQAPLEGIGIISLDNDPKKYLVNIKIMYGIFEGYCLQLLLTFSDQYPIKPPRILIYPGQCFNNTYHHHIFQSEIKDEKNQYFNKFCFDLLDNDFLPTSSEAHTGWNPSYTISTLLLQVQTFLANPDFPNGYIPDKEKIDELFKSMDNYEKSFIIKNDNDEEIIKVHTWKNPYPEMYFKNNYNVIIINKNINNIENEENNKLKVIKENLTCFISRINYIDNKNMILGYPIQKLNNGALIPLPEILSYDCYIEESSKINNNNGSDDYYINNHNNVNYITFPILRVDYELLGIFSNIGSPIFLNRSIRRFRPTILNQILFNINGNSNYIFKNVPSFKSPNNELYDSWLPIYINDEHFEKNKTTILNYFSILKYGNNGLKMYDFQPKYIFETIPNILSSMVTNIIKKNISPYFITCFFQYILMFKKLEKKYNKAFIEYQKYYLRNKMIDILNDIWHQEKAIDIKKELLELFIIFLICDNEINENLKEEIKKYIRILKNIILFQLLDHNKICYYINKNLLIKDLKKFNIFDNLTRFIIEEYRSDYYFSFEEQMLIYFIKDKIRNKIMKDNKSFYKILKKLIKVYITPAQFIELDFSKYFNVSKLYTSLNSDFNLLDKSYEFISAFQIIKETIFSNNFLENLEKNFGVYLDSENFIELIKNKKEATIFEKFKILKTYDIFSVMELIALNSFYQNYLSEYLVNRFTFSYREKNNILDIIDKLIVEENTKYYKRHINKEMKINDSQKEQRNRISIKNSYNKNYDKRFDKYINKKNITRLLLFKRNFY